MSLDAIKYKLPAQNGWVLFKRILNEDLANIESPLIGIGSGNTVRAFVNLLQANTDWILKRKVHFVFSGKLALPSPYKNFEDLNLPITKIKCFGDDGLALDLVIDGADHVIYSGHNKSSVILVKGKGGAFINENILIQNSKCVLIIASSDKILTSGDHIKMQVTLYIDPSKKECALNDLKFTFDKIKSTKFVYDLLEKAETERMDEYYNYLLIGMNISIKQLDGSHQSDSDENLNELFTALEQFHSLKINSIKSFGICVLSSDIVQVIS